MIQHHAQDHEQDNSWAFVPCTIRNGEASSVQEHGEGTGREAGFGQRLPSLLVPNHMLTPLRTQAAEVWERVRVIFSAIQLALAWWQKAI